jgi:hypothetical protein
MSEEQTNFKVTDRRLFNPDGSARDVPPEEKPEAPREVKADEIPVQTPEPFIASAPELADSETEVPLQSPYPAQPQLADEEPKEPELIGADDPASFANFIMSIASNAASSLGMMEHPVTGKREVDLELGKHWIDILGMLQQKTRGNLLAQEQQVLEGLLADLRMQFVSLTNAAPPKARKFTGSDITGGR